jgi:hypothetical protein
VRMLFAMISVKNTSTDEAMFGSSSLNMTRNELAPCAVAASMNSFSRSDRICRAAGARCTGSARTR